MNEPTELILNSATSAANSKLLLLQKSEKMFSTKFPNVVDSPPIAPTPPSPSSSPASATANGASAPGSPPISPPPASQTPQLVAVAESQDSNKYKNSDKDKDIVIDNDNEDGPSSSPIIVIPTSPPPQPRPCSPTSTSPRSSRSSSTPPHSPSLKISASQIVLNSSSRQTISRPPSLFQPFLPSTTTTTTTPSRQQQQQQQHLIQAVSNPMQQLQRQFLPFSIDNILRPNFGGHPNPLLDLAASLHHQQQLLQHHQQHLKNLASCATLATAPIRVLTPKSTSTTTTTALASKSHFKLEPKSPTESNNNNSSSNSHPVDLSSKNSSSSSESDSNGSKDQGKDEDLPPGMVRGPNGQLWPAWVFCTRYSDRPSSGPRSRKIKKSATDKDELDRSRSPSSSSAEKRPRTAFSSDQLARLKREFDDNRYLTEERRKSLATELGLNENQIKIWFQNKRAKIKKSTGSKGELAQMLMAQGLYNHSTVPVDEDDNPIY